MSFDHAHVTQLPSLSRRPQVMGREVAIACDHYLAAEAGMQIAREGGNAVDIAAAVCFCQTVLKPSDVSMGGECPVLVYSARERRTFAISGVVTGRV